MKLFLWLTLLACGAVVSAHSELVSSSPAADSTVQNRPESVTLTFTEAVEPGFSLFIVYPLTRADQTALKDNSEAFLAQALTATDSAQFDVQPASADASETMVLPLPETLTPGTYAVIWRALSADTHTGQDFLVFTYQP